MADGLYGGCGQIFSAWSIGMCRSAVRRQASLFYGCASHLTFRYCCVAVGRLKFQAGLFKRAKAFPARVVGGAGVEALMPDSYWMLAPLVVPLGAPLCPHSSWNFVLIAALIAACCSAGSIYRSRLGFYGLGF